MKIVLAIVLIFNFLYVGFAFIDANTSAGPDFSTFHSNDHSFDPALNQAYCDKRYTILPFNESIRDYYAMFRSELGSLVRKGGGTVRLKSGVYVISRQVEIPSFVCIIGAGIEATTIKVADFSHPYILEGAIRTVNSRYVTIKELTLDGNRDSKQPQRLYGRHGFYGMLSNYVWIHRVRFRNNYGYGIALYGNETHLSSYLIIEGAEVTGNGYDGIKISRSQFISIVGSISSRNSRHGLNIVSGSRFVAVVRCSFAENGVKTGYGCGIEVQSSLLFRTRGVLIRKSLLTNNVLAGVCLKSVKCVHCSRIIVQQNSPAPCFKVRNSYAQLSDSKCTTMPGREIAEDANSIIEQIRMKYAGLFDGYFPASSPDPSCTRGIREAELCCPLECVSCSGTGCESRQPGGVCCLSTALALRRSCMQHGPPCFIGSHSRLKDASADHKCTFGIRVGDLCCAYGCSVCGSQACDDARTVSDCCDSAIRKKGRSCNNFRAPCILPSNRNLQELQDCPYFLNFEYKRSKSHISALPNIPISTKQARFPITKQTSSTQVSSSGPTKTPTPKRAVAPTRTPIPASEQKLNNSTMTERSNKSIYASKSSPQASKKKLQNTCTIEN